MVTEPHELIAQPQLKHSTKYESDIKCEKVTSNFVSMSKTECICQGDPYTSNNSTSLPPPPTHTHTDRHLLAILYLYFLRKTDQLT